jgi:Zn-dependent protease with chaperone function
MLLAFVSQSILHAFVAALFVEALLRAWRIEDGVWRLRFRLLALAVPVLWLPGLLLVAPFRSSSVFVAHWALFAGERWNQVRLAGTGLGDLALLIAAGLGSALFLRDALPPLLDLLRGLHHMPDAGPWHATVSDLRAVTHQHATRLGIAVPEIRVVRTSTPVLLCEGAFHPVLVVSPATLERLRGDELDVGVAHELAHAQHRDPAWGYGLIAVRAVLFFNPAAQWIARALVDDIERRADQVAVSVTGNAPGLARVISLLFDAGHPPPVDGGASFERVFWRVRKEGVERRCGRLRQASVMPSLERGPALFAMAALGVFGLVFFVV